MDWNTYIGLSSVMIALCALAYTLWQGKLLQNHNKLSFKPHITSWLHNNLENGKLTIEVANNGLGPAIIESFVVEVDGEVMKGGGTEPIENGLKKLFPDISHHSTQAFMGNGYVIAAKEICTILMISFPEDSPVTPAHIDQTFNREKRSVTLGQKATRARTSGLIF